MQKREMLTSCLRSSLSKNAELLGGGDLNARVVKTRVAKRRCSTGLTAWNLLDKVLGWFHRFGKDARTNFLPVLVARKLHGKTPKAIQWTQCAGGHV